MNIHDAEYQAEKLVAFMQRRGCAATWYRSKGFSKSDREQIRAALRAMSRGAEHAT